MKRGRIEHGSEIAGKKSRPDITISHVESDEDIDLDNTYYTQIQFESTKKSGSLVTPRNQNNQTQKVIRCTPGTSRFQGQGTPKSSRSGNKFHTAGTSRIQLLLEVQCFRLHRQAILFLHFGTVEKNLMTLYQLTRL